MSLLLALVGVEPVVVGRRFKKYAKGYVRKGHKVLVFETEELAREYLEAEEQAKKAYASMQVTGLHVTQEEMKHRTDGLNASNTSKAPECHG